VLFCQVLAAPASGYGGSNEASAHQVEMFLSWRRLRASVHNILPALCPACIQHRQWHLRKAFLAKREGIYLG